LGSQSLSALTSMVRKAAARSLRALPDAAAKPNDFLPPVKPDSGH
jgi:hypothetical protein